MRHPENNERGAAMVLALGVMAVLAVLAIVVISIVIAEKRTSSSEYANDRAFYSADAAGEAGVHWLRRQLSPPALLDSLNCVRPTGADIALADDHVYFYQVTYVAKRFRPGYSVEFKDFVYRVGANGTSAQNANAVIDLNATRLYREGY